MRLRLKDLSNGELLINSRIITKNDKEFMTANYAVSVCIFRNVTH